MTPSDSEFLSAVPVIENVHNKRRKLAGLACNDSYAGPFWDN